MPASDRSNRLEDLLLFLVGRRIGVSVAAASISPLGDQED